MLISFSIFLTERASAAETNPMWVQTYGGVWTEEARCLIRTTDGGYAIAGTTRSFGAGGQDCWLIKIDASGNMEWNKTYGGPMDDGASCLIQTTDGGYVIAGSTRSFGAGGQDCWLIKTDGNGNVDWSQTYGGTADDWSYYIVEISSGGYALAGTTYSFGAGDCDCWLIKTDGNGKMEWNQTYGGTGWDRASCVVETSDGRYILSGYTASFGAGGTDFWLIKTDSSGKIEWNKTYGGTMDDGAISIVETSDGGYALAGDTESFGVGLCDYWLIKTDSLGNMEWNQTYGGTDLDWPNSLITTSDGGYAIAGSTRSYGSGDYDCWLIKTDSLGNMEWNKTYGGAYFDEAFSLIATPDGGYAIVGSTLPHALAEGTDIWIGKTDENGIISEFPSWVILPLLVTATLVTATIAVMIYRKKTKG